MSKITIMDGGMGRQLQAMGAPFRQPEWSALALIESPDTVHQAHDAFIDAGAEIIITNTYALVPFHIGQERFDTQGSNLIQNAANIARETADSASHQVQVAGSIPPALGSYRPDLFNADIARKIYAPLIEHQKDKIDFWLAETMSSVAEANLLIDMTKDTSRDLWISFSLSDETDPNEPSLLRSGETIDQAIETALNGNAKALLFNCSQPEVMASAFKTIQKHNIPIPYGAYANTFPAVNRTKDNQANEGLSSLRKDITPKEYLAYAQTWKALGATIIGGCCGIGPEHIAALGTLND